MRAEDAIYVVLPFVVIALLGAGFWVVFRQRGAWRREAQRRDVAGSGGPAGRVGRPDVPPSGASPGRRPTGIPWWSHPLVWLVLAAAFVLLGVFVTPRLFGGVIILLPFLWIGRWPRRAPRRPDASQNGHRRPDG
jgi:hypothetical protein